MMHLSVWSSLYLYKHVIFIEKVQDVYPPPAPRPCAVPAISLAAKLSRPRTCGSRLLISPGALVSMPTRATHPQFATQQSRILI